MYILAKEEHHFSLSESYIEIMISATFRTSNTQFHNSCLSPTMSDLKGQSEQTVSYSANTGLTPTANTIETGPTEPVLINIDQIE